MPLLTRNSIPDEDEGEYSSDARLLNIHSPCCGCVLTRQTLFIMDVDLPSSNGRLSLPPSSAPFATNNTTTPRSRLTRTVDPLALDDDNDPPEVEAEEDGRSSRRRVRAQNQRQAHIPVVKDATGEKVMESFEVFLKS